MVEVVRSRRDPAAALQGWAAAADDAVQVVVVPQGLAPGVQDGGDPQLRAQVIPAEAQQRFSSTGKEQIVERLLVLPNQGVELVRQSEHQVEIGDRQEQPGLGREPVRAVDALAGGTMPVAAGVGSEMDAAAVSAFVLVSAQQRRAANLDGVEDLPVMWRKPMRAGIGRQAGTQYFGQQQRGRTRDRAGGRFWTSARHSRASGWATRPRD